MGCEYVFLCLCAGDRQCLPRASLQVSLATVRLAFCCASKFAEASFCAVRPGEEKSRKWSELCLVDILVGDYVCCQTWTVEIKL